MLAQKLYFYKWLFSNNYVAVHIATVDELDITTLQQLKS